MPKIPVATCLLAMLSLLTAGEAAASPQTASYAVKPACAKPALGHAACLALRAERRTDAGVVSPASAPGLILPQELHDAYSLPTEAGEPQTIALVDAYDDPHAEEDLAVYDKKFDLPACTHADDCFTKVNQQGQSSPLPPENGEWSEEIATDVEVAHSLCENCKIVLVEADTDEFSDLEAAENTAAAEVAANSKPGALEGEISNSWGGEEPPSSLDSSAFDHPGIPITSAAGDSGYLNWDEYATRNEKESGYFDGPDYPASSPHVIAVGGTKLSVNAEGEWASEEVWNEPSDVPGESGGGGGGCSRDFAPPAWQSQTPGWSAVGCGPKRAVADVSADADPATGVPVYDSVPVEEGGKTEVPKWIEIGGTSVASPIIASAFALAGGAHGVPYPAATLYANAGSAGLHDITLGGNGECDSNYTGSCNGSLESPLDCGSTFTICNAAPGYDGPTGVGTPDGLSAFLPVPGEIGGPEASPSAGGGEGAGGSTGSSGTPSSPSSPSTPAKPLQVSAKIVLTRLSLTLGAVVALNRSHPGLSTVAFTFSISTAAKVRVTLSRRTRVHGHWVWKTLPGANTITAGAGTNRAHLSGRGALPRGLYRLTLTPAGGVARTLTIAIG